MKEILKKNLLTRELIIKILFSIILIIVFCRNINKNLMPYLSPDEIGYWTAAAWINGIDWSSTMHQSPYYGYGLGLLYAPLFLLNDPQKMYLAGEILNILLIILSYWILMSISSKLNKMDKGIKNTFVCFIIMLYSYNIIYSHMNSAEILLVFLYLLSIRIFIYYSESNKLYVLIFLSIIIIYSICTHLRMLIVLISSVIALLYSMILNKNKKYSHLLVYLMFLCCGYFFYSMFKNQLIEAEYMISGTSSYISANDNIGEKVGVLKNFFSVNFQRNFFSLIVGKFFYLGCSSQFLIYWGIYSIIKKVIYVVRENRTLNITIELYIILSMVGGIMITVLTFIYPGRIDVVIYGRYMDCFCMPILLYGIHEFFIAEKKVLYTFCFFLFSSISAIIVESFMRVENLSTTLNIQAPGIAGMPLIEGIDNIIYASTYAFIFCALFIVVGFLISFRSRTVYLLFLGFAWFINAYRALDLIVYDDFQILRRQSLYEISNELKDVERKIYYLSTKDKYTTAYFNSYYFQFFMVDRDFQVIYEDDLNELEGEYYLVLNKSLSTISNLIERFDIISEDELCYIVQKR